MAQGLNLSDFKKSNYGTVIVIGLIVLALIFAPDFMKFKGIKTAEEKAAVPQETKITDTNKFDNGYFDRVIDAKVSGKSIDSIDPNNPGWDFTSEKSKKVLAEARKQSLDLAALVPPDATASRFALYNYANGLQSVVSIKGTADEKEISEFLTKLDLDVSKALTEERQSRNILFAWSKISIADALGNKRTERFKQGIVPTFNPKLYLSEVGLSYTIPAPGEFSTSSAYEVGFTLMFDASEVSKFELYQNGLLLTEKKLPKDAKGFSNHVVRNADASGYYSVIVYDQYGYKAIKHYRFIPKDVKKLPWKLINNRKYGVLIKAKDEQDSLNMEGVFGYALDDSNVFLPSTSNRYELF